MRRRRLLHLGLATLPAWASLGARAEVWGYVDGRGVASLRVDAPQAGLLQYLPRSAKRPTFRSVGEPDWAITMALWTPQEWAQFRAAVARDAGAETGKKMEHTLAAPSAGTITEIAAAVGAQVAEGVKLMLIAPQKKE